MPKLKILESYKKYAIIEIKSDFIKFISNDARILMKNNHTLVNTKEIYYMDRFRNSKLVSFSPNSSHDIKDDKYKYFWLIKDTNFNKNSEDVPFICIKNNDGDIEPEKVARVYVKFVSGKLIIHFAYLLKPNF